MANIFLGFTPDSTFHKNLKLWHAYDKIN